MIINTLNILEGCNQVPTCNLNTQEEEAVEQDHQKVSG